MGAKETVPFSIQEQADKFSKKYGGQVVSYKEIPSDYVIGGDHSRKPNS